MTQEFLNMYKPDRILESKTQKTYPSQTFTNSQTENASYPSFCSPFRKHLPIIYENQGSPHQSFDTEKADYLKSQYESRLIAVDEELFGSQAQGSIPNDSRMLNQREKQLLNKVYEKEKQLVILENKLHLLKNSNECLRDTIKQDQIQKQQLNEQIYKLSQQSENLKQQSAELKQQIALLNQKIVQLQAKVNEYQTQQTQEQQFFREYDLKSRSIQQLHKQNTLLKKEIQQLKAFYEEQFYQMLENHQETIRYLEQRIKSISEENSELEFKAQDLSEKLLAVNNQKKDILSYYLKVIEDMKRQIHPIHSNPVTVSQNFLQHDSIYEPKSDYSPENNATTINQNIDLSIYDHNSKSFEIGKYIGKVMRNGSKDKSRSKSKNNTKSRPKQIHKSGSVSELNLLSMNINMESNPKLNTTLMSYKYTDRVLPTKRYKNVSPIKRPLSPITHHSILSIKMPISSFLSKQMDTPRLRTNPHAKKYQEIDKKLQVIKEKITKEITY